MTLSNAISLAFGALKVVAVAAAITVAAGACLNQSPDQTLLDGVPLETTEPSASALQPDDSAAGPTDPQDPDDSDPNPSPQPFLGNYTPRIVATYPHDPTAYTQGLELYNDVLLESTGLEGRSDRRAVNTESGQELRSTNLADNEFGEGLTVVGDEVFQLTWLNGEYIRSDAETLTEIGRGTYDGEGWGLCYDGSRLVMSNGSDQLTFRDPTTFEPVASVAVTLADGTPVALLNELECVNGQVFANVYGSEVIVVIDPATGAVVATIDASSLRPEGAPADDLDYALNGIAFNPESGTFYLTGKWWPALYEVELIQN